VVLLAACGGHGTPRFPATPTRLVADDQLSADAALALGLHPVAAVGLSDTEWAPPLARYLTHAENLGSRTGGSANLDAVSGASPDAILGPVSLEQQGWAGQLRHLAPTALYTPTPAGAPWTVGFLAIADALGRQARGRSVVAGLRLRADAIRPQLEGKKVALLRIHHAQSFSTANDYDPAVGVYEHDLGLMNAHLRPQQYGNRCAPAPVPPRACSTNQLFVAIASRLTDVDGVLLEAEPAGAEASKRFIASEYFRGLPAVRAGRVAIATSYEEVGPLGVAFLYDSIERLFGLEELHATLPDGVVELTYQRSSGKVCWAGSTSRPLSLTALHARIALVGASGCRYDPALGPLLADARVGGRTLEHGPSQIDDA
jgi:ABC-type Fe3+-hydroxamate transport system substrate-binding protein